ncbi:MAG: class I SAM-dependent methyltransferase [Tenericutes bacterium]|nr:class I SAM-dependent methyltransferase [Mycoplasmatota bacterium]
MIKLSKRLASIALNIDKEDKVVDIGCDHGYLSIYLKAVNGNKIVIATDINENALNMAKKNINKNRILIETRLGNGLDVINYNEVDTIIISGMGGNTILNILKKNKLKYIKKIVIQSNTDIPLIRKYINKLGYTIKNEQLIIDKNIYYIIITFSKGKHKYTKKELYFGPILLKENNELFKKKKTIELNKLEKILEKIPNKKIITKYKLKKLIKLYKN